MRAIFTIALREWRGLYLSPLAWALWAVLFLIHAYMFGAALFNYAETHFRYQSMGQAISLTEWTAGPVLGNAAILLLLVVPLVSMRLIAGEKRAGSWPAIASSPLSPMQIVGGKFLGLLLFLAVTVGLLGLLPLSLLWVGHPDLGQVAAMLLGLFLLAASFGAVGLAASSATDNPMVAAVATFGVLLLLWICAWLGDATGGAMDQMLAYLSLTKHYEKFIRGTVSSADLIYFLLLTAAGLLFARQRLMAERIQG